MHFSFQYFALLILLFILLASFSCSFSCSFFLHYSLVHSLASFSCIILLALLLSTPHVPKSIFSALFLLLFAMIFLAWPISFSCHCLREFPVSYGLATRHIFLMYSERENFPEPKIPAALPPLDHLLASR